MSNSRQWEKNTYTEEDARESSVLCHIFPFHPGSQEGKITSDRPDV